MRKSMMTLVGVLMLPALPVAAFDLGGFADSASKAMEDVSGTADSVQDGARKAADMQDNVSSLLGSLTGDLGVTDKQAAGGAGALLALAQNQLPENQFDSVLDKVPGLDGLIGQSGGIASQMQSLQSVMGAFKSLGLSPDMVMQFAPKILSFLGDKGVGGPLLESLSGLWGVKE